MSQSLTQLTSNFWVSQSDFYFTNCGIFIADGQACIIDPGIFPREIEAVANFLHERDVASQVIVLTHGHWDHVLGPEHFPDVSVITQANYVNKTSGKYNVRICRQVDEWEANQGIAREQRFVIPRPDETFDEGMSLTVGSLSLELVHAPGHAADQLIVYRADNGTLWAADMLSDIEMPYVCDSLVAYERTLEMLSAFEISLLVPGHGHATSVSTDIQTRITEDKDYLAELREKVTRAIREGKTAEETVADCESMQHPLLEGNQAPHRLNVESIFLELGGEVNRSELGWGQFVNNT